MSIAVQEENVSIGSRLKFERDRLGYTQKALAAILETTEKTLIAYETGATLPKISKLIAFHGFGADLLFILVGKRQPADLQNPSSPAQCLAAAIAELDLSESDANLVLPIAQRLVSR